MDVGTTYHRAVEFFADRLNAVKDDQWNDPTPCSAWTVRDLANHVAYEDLWTVPLMEGATIEDVGDRFEGDVLGADPIGSALTAARAAIGSVAAHLPRGGDVHLSFGETPSSEYAMQLAADHLIHGWDLAVAAGGDTRMDPHLVHAVADWFDDREETYRAAGAVAARQVLTGDSQHDLLARFGRDWAWGANHKALIRFNSAFGSGDLDAALALVTDDIVFETTSPAPDGQRHEGRAAVGAAWADVLGTTGLSFSEEESFVSGDRAVVRWQYGWAGSDPGHVRGVDVIRFRDGLICEKFSYVKG
ncbi:MULTISPECIES: TIGR03086 family metal-binding protein [unclassified Nocardioides]|uniref:TIGR03086 family metal-binding protein n=1 Tax=unclassified Nocardioides TaxID=2615069 RepID=UPI00361E5318